jgi:hypothetical protein
LPASIGAMLVFAFLLGQALGLPEAENPIPEKIGLEDVFTFAGAVGVLGGIACFGSPSAKREQGIKWGVLIGFCLGAAVYCLLLLFQVLSAL